MGACQGPISINQIKHNIQRNQKKQLNNFYTLIEHELINIHQYQSFHNKLKKLFEITTKKNQFLIEYIERIYFLLQQRLPQKMQNIEKTYKEEIQKMLNALLINQQNNFCQTKDHKEQQVADQKQRVSILTQKINNQQFETLQKKDHELFSKNDYQNQIQRLQIKIKQLQNRQKYSLDIISSLKKQVQNFSQEEYLITVESEKQRLYKNSQMSLYGQKSYLNSNQKEPQTFSSQKIINRSQKQQNQEKIIVYYKINNQKLKQKIKNLEKQLHQANQTNQFFQSQLNSSFITVDIEQYQSGLKNLKQQNKYLTKQSVKKP